MAPNRVDQYRRWFEYEKDSHRKVLASFETVPPGPSRVRPVPEGAGAHGSHHRGAAGMAVPVRRREGGS